MNRGRPNHLENGVIGLAVLLALVLAYFGAQKALRGRDVSRDAGPAAPPRSTIRGALIGSGTESAITGVPPLKLSGVRSRRSTRSPAPPPPAR